MCVATLAKLKQMFLLIFDILCCFFATTLTFFVLGQPLSYPTQKGFILKVT